MNVKAGGRLVWRGRTYEVVMVNPLAAAIRDEEGVEAEVSLDELSQTAEPADAMLPGRLMDLSALESESSAEYDVWRTAVERLRTVSADGGVTRQMVAEEAERISQELKRPIGVRTLYRRLRAFRELGDAGLLDGRMSGLRARRGNNVDPRVTEAECPRTRRPRGGCEGDSYSRCAATPAQSARAESRADRGCRFREQSRPNTTELAVQLAMLLR